MTQWNQIRSSRYVVSPEGQIRRIGRSTGHTRGPGREVRGKIGPKDLKWVLSGNRPAVFININPEDLVNGKAKWWGIAELVLEAYVAKRQGSWVPKWKNGQRADCSVENLSWGFREGGGVRVPWTYRKRGFAFTHVDGNKKLRYGMLDILLKQRSQGVETLAYRFDIDPPLVQRVLDGRFDMDASREAGYLTGRS